MGKQMLIYVIGLSMLTAFAVLNLNKTSLSSQDTFSMYFSKSMVHNIALAGANMGTHLCLNDTAYSTSLTNQPFNGGKYDIIITKSGDSTRIRSIGHIPTRYYDYAVGSWKTEMVDTVEAKLQRLYFSRYGYFSASETNGYLDTNNNVPGGDMWKVTGDSMYGPVHTNGGWHFSGSPYFDSKITAANTPTLSDFFGTPNPIYNGGYQWGITINRPIARLNELEAAASGGGKLYTSASTTGQDVGVEFLATGQVKVRVPWNTTTASKITTYATISTLAPNGIIAVKGIDVRVWGTYNGQATVLARTTGSSYNRKGNIWIQGNLVAADNPQTNVNSDDILGLVSERMTYVTTTGITPARTSASQTNIQAAIYCQNGVFAVENYNSCGNDGRLNLFGGATMNASTSTGTISGGVLTNGMLKSFRHDPRFLTKAPPSFPFSDKYQLVAWWEN